MATNINLSEGHFFISVGGNRLKQYPDNTVYLDNGKEFQLEVFNPTTSKVLAKIKINGEYISSSGLVLKPGQRVFLERYFDIAKKFKFETYTVDDSPATAAAIAKNGLIEIEFYKEHVPVQYYTINCNPIITTQQPWWQWNNTSNPYYSSGGGCIGTTTTGNINLNSTLNNGDEYKNVSSQSAAKQKNSSSGLDGMLRKETSSYSDNNSSFYSQQIPVSSSYCDTTSFPTLDFLEMNFERSVSSEPQPKAKETGRVEAGSSSSQSFVTDYATYNSWYSSKVTWKIIPTSQKPLEVSDLKVFCAMCGAQKKKETFKFCPHCGAKFE